MTRRVYIYDSEKGRMVEVTRQQASPQVHYIRDSMDLTWNPALPKSNPKAWFTSKSKFRDATRAAGFYEVGNDNHSRGQEKANIDVKGAMERVQRRQKYKND